jgi:hypothetical protein
LHARGMASLILGVVRDVHSFAISFDRKKSACVFVYSFPCLRMSFREFHRFKGAFERKESNCAWRTELARRLAALLARTLDISSLSKDRANWNPALITSVVSTDGSRDWSQTASVRDKGNELLSRHRSHEDTCGDPFKPNTKLRRLFFFAYDDFPSFWKR